MWSWSLIRICQNENSMKLYMKLDIFQTTKNKKIFCKFISFNLRSLHCTNEIHSFQLFWFFTLNKTVFLHRFAFVRSATANSYELIIHSFLLDIGQSLHSVSLPLWLFHFSPLKWPPSSFLFKYKNIDPSIDGRMSQCFTVTFN